MPSLYQHQNKSLEIIQAKNIRQNIQSKIHRIASLYFKIQFEK
jgi:hypothetical protein